MGCISWGKAKEALQKHRASLLRRKGVVGVDLGVALVNGHPTKVPAIRIHVREKLPREKLFSHQILPERLDGVRVDVIQARYTRMACASAARQFRRKRNPLFGSVAISRYRRKSFGTLAALVDDENGGVFALTAQHVVGSGKPRVVQPRRGGLIGTVESSHLNQTMDAALVTLNRRFRGFKGVVGDFGEIAGIVDPIPLTSLPLPVEIHGACSGHTLGFIDSNDATIRVKYGGSIVTFQHQLHLVADQSNTILSQGGDSGSLVFERGTNRAVGLLFAGGERTGSSPDYAVATPIRRVLDHFGVSFFKGELPRES